MSAYRGQIEILYILYYKYIMYFIFYIIFIFYNIRAYLYFIWKKKIGHLILGTIRVHLYFPLYK